MGFIVFWNSVLIILRNMHMECFTHVMKTTANILEIAGFTRMYIHYLNTRGSEIVATCLYSVTLYLLTLPLDNFI